MILRLELYSSGFNYVIQHYIFIHPEIPTPGIMLKIRTPDDIRGVGSIIYTSSNQAIAISKSNNPLNMCLFIILFNYFYYNYHYV